ncbi:MAG TPA: bifunctional diaminohydroxyphosphoribosylaminopyrimidine deaminase/5-amino-6-(5-phosphoribosylamino)uracil reductase RibD [Burkholderiaceae bacterium]|nr:bifunctional diaminohydroxyphosphoribosylaminopyrimidine deaminase/5-amino-6-(5-phosphoribosylamino)uracil reductase RibD [Burkholderiaceae bacterium]
MFTPADHDFMQRALQLAELGLFTATPNPRVGCVVVRDNAIVGEGWHRRAGEPHAEVLALAQAGERARGGTAYVTLEPCNHHGRTPPCVDALIEARVGRVIAAMEDPNPSVNGAGLERLRAAGIDVRCGLLQQEARDLNIGFVSRMARGRPWVRLKVATSLDGRTALPDGRSQWITGEAARADGHAWRARACAILTGIGTVRDDNPQLTVRHVQTSRQPLRVLVDSRFEVNPAARILEGGSTLVACAVDAAKRVAKTAALEELGCEVITLPDANGKVDLAGLLLELARRGINELHVEAGYRLNGSLLREECIDELLVYMAPTLLGNSMGLADLAPPEALEKRLVLHWQSVERVGDDLRLLARLPERI